MCKQTEPELVKKKSIAQNNIIVEIITCFLFLLVLYLAKKSTNALEKEYDD